MSKGGRKNYEECLILDISWGCLADALAYIHDQKIRHKDIKPQNILVHERRLLYTDFALSRDYSDNDQSTTTGRPNALTRRYCAPEVADHAPRNRKSDVLSLGCVFLEMLMAIRADVILSNSEGAPYYSILDKIADTLQKSSSHFILPFISFMVERVQEDRPSAEEITNDLDVEFIYSSMQIFCQKCRQWSGPIWDWKRGRYYQELKKHDGTFLYKWAHGVR